MLDRLALPDALVRMKELGFEGVEICVEDAQFRIRAELLDPAVLRDGAAVIRELGFASSYSYHANYLDDDDILRRTIQTIELTPETGSDVFVFSGRRRSKLADPADEWKLLVERTRPLARAAAANGVRLALEAEPGFVCGTSAELLRLIDEIGSESLGCNMDIGHSFLCDPDPIAAIRELGGRIFHAHLEDMRRGVHDHMLPGTGDMNLQECIDALSAAGFAGVAALDLYGYDYEEVAPEAITMFRALVASTKKNNS
jgi:sugar phosphate isomerase/epimerase